MRRRVCSDYVLDKLHDPCPVNTAIVFRVAGLHQLKFMGNATCSKFCMKFLQALAQINTISTSLHHASSLLNHKNKKSTDKHLRYVLNDSDKGFWRQTQTEHKTVASTHRVAPSGEVAGRGNATSMLWWFFVRSWAPLSAWLLWQWPGPQAGESVPHHTTACLAVDLFAKSITE